MHIAIDARMYGTAQRGIGRYLMKLIEHLEIVDKENTYTIFLRRANWDEYTPRNQNFTKALWDVPWYGWREQVTSYQLPVTSYDLFHFPHWNVPLLFNQPFVVTIHDLELFSSNRTRENTTRGRFVYWLKYLAFRMVFRHAVLASRAIIVPSQAVREQLLDKYPQVRKKVHIVHEAPTIAPTRHSERSEESHTSHMARCEIATSPSAPRNDIGEHFVLYVGSAYPHKNLVRLLEAWKIVRQELPGYKLVLVGKEDWFWEKLKKQLCHSEPTHQSGDSVRGRLREESPTSPEANAPREQNVGPHRQAVRSFGLRPQDDESGVIFYGPATDEELTALYTNAALLVQPSLEEGFSLSPLEALAHGCPVAVSNIPVHREILSEAAFYFDPRDVQAIAVNVKEALTNSVARNTRVMHGQALLPRYAWTNHAQQTLGVYLRAL